MVRRGKNEAFIYREPMKGYETPLWKKKKNK